MKWILFTGTWRLTDETVEKDVRKAACEVISKGDGILTGGATGVDYFAIDEAFTLDQNCSHIKVIIPANLENYINDYYLNWQKKPVTKKDIDNLAFLLKKIKNINPKAVIEMSNIEITQEHYNLRNIEEIKFADEVYAFQVNESTGTQHTIDNALKNNLPVILYKKYKIIE